MRVGELLLVAVAARTALAVRPGYHYTRPAGWMNDPVPFYDRETGRFHLFPICDPNSTSAPWAGGWQAWCHASSPDMARSWTTHPPAIPVPAPGTGNAVALPAGSQPRAKLGGRVAIFTASARPFAPELWVSSDQNLTTWRQAGLVKLPSPPNLPGLLATADVHAFHDPQRGVYRLITSGVFAKGTPPALLQYESDGDLLSGWRFAGALYTAERPDSNRLECPSYAPLNHSQALLVYSLPARGYAQWWASGVQAANGSFSPTGQRGQLEYGIGYAAEMTSSLPGRLVLFSWLRGVSDRSSFVGAQSLPRELGLTAAGALTVQPAPELEALIVGSSTTQATLTAPAPLPQPVAQQATLRVSAQASGATVPASFGINLVAGPNSAGTFGLAELALSFVVSSQGTCVTVSPRQGCAPIRSAGTQHPGGPWAVEVDAELWLDNGLVEVFATNCSSSLSAFYPALYSASAGLNGTLWAQGNTSAKFELEWSTVASATHNIM